MSLVPYRLRRTARYLYGVARRGHARDAIAMAHAVLALPSVVHYLPQHLKCEITTRCNLRCRFCGRTYDPQYGQPEQQAGCSMAAASPSAGFDMSLDQFRALADQLPALTTLDIQGTGEPLMSPWFRQILEYCARRGIGVEFFTNATLLGPGATAEILISTTSCMSVSLDAPTGDLYEQIRVGARLASTVENVQSFMAERKRRDQTHPRVRVMMVVATVNVHTIPEMAQLCAALGVDELVVSRINVPVPQLASLACEDDVLVESLLSAGQVAEKVGLKLSDETGVLARADPGAAGADHRPAPKCLWPWYSANVLVDGTVTPCPFISYAPDLSMGNVGKRSFTAVWNDLAYQSLRAAHRAGSLAGLPCETCRNHTL